MNEYTDDWQKYQNGLNYQAKINLLANADKAEKFYSNKHWEGVKANGLPTAIIPVTQQIVDLKVAVVMSNAITMQYSAEGIADDTQDPDEQMIKQMVATLSQYSKTVWENLKLDNMNENGLLDAALTGDMVSYWYWHEMGNDVCGELVDNVNYFPGDPNLDEVNNAYGPVQPYIILSFRRQVADVKEEAKNNGVPEDELLNIVSDDDSSKQSGYMAKTELEKNEDGGKCTVLLKLWKELDPENKQYKIMARKSTKEVVIRKSWDTGLHRYPVGVYHWRKRKGSAHGEGEVTSLIPNQILINKFASMIALWVQLHGFPKVLYDKTRIASWTNDLSVAIGVNGTDTGGVSGAAQYMVPAQMSSIVQKFLEWFIETTKKMFGANESILGESAPTNTSAIVVNSQNAVVPLNGQKHRFYNYIEDIGLIWYDFWLSKNAEYPERKLEITKDNVKSVVSMDFSKLKGVKPKLKIDVGPSTQWSEAAITQTLTAMVDKQWITFVEALKRMPNGTIPDKQGLITAREGQETTQREADKKLLYELVAEFVKTLPPEQQNQLQGLTVEQVKGIVAKIVDGRPIRKEVKTPTIPYEQLPTTGKIQMAKQAGIDLTENDVLEQEVNKQADEMMLKKGGQNNGMPIMQKPVDGSGE